jgi:hypothetical protein
MFHIKGHMFHIKGHQSAQQAAEHRTSFHFKGRLGSQYPRFLSTIDVPDRTHCVERLVFAFRPPEEV